MDILRDMQLFVEVAKATSFRGAAEVTGVPASTVSRRIAALERELGLRLFHRTTRRVELTESGRLHHENCRRIVREAELAHQQLLDLKSEPGGVVRASVPVDFATNHLPPMLAAFARRHPRIALDLDVSPSRADLAGGRVDVALRIGEPDAPDAIARRVGSFPCGLYATSAYLDARGRPARPDDLLEHECLRVRDAPWILRGPADETCTVAVTGQFVANSPGLLRALMLEGHGIAVLTERMVGRDDVDGVLERVLPGWAPPNVPVFALVATRLLPARVRLFVDFMVERLAEHAT